MTAVRVHPTAIVDPAAELADGVVVEPYAIVGPRVKIGPESRIGAHAVVDGNTTLGARNVVFHHASVGAVPQDLKFHGEDSVLEIGDDNVIREFATLHLGTENGGMVTRLGDGNLIMNYAHVGHDCILGNRNIIANGAQLGGHVVLQDFVRVGALVGVHQFARIGEGAILGAGAMVSQDVPPFCNATGDRARLYGLNLEGLRRLGKSPEVIAQIKHAYRIVFRSQLKLAEALDRVRAEIRDCPEVDRFVAFIAASERGVARETTGH